MESEPLHRGSIARQSVGVNRAAYDSTRQLPGLALVNISNWYFFTEMATLSFIVKGARIYNPIPHANVLVICAFYSKKNT